MPTYPGTNAPLPAPSPSTDAHGLRLRRRASRCGHRCPPKDWNRPATNVYQLLELVLFFKKRLKTCYFSPPF